MNRTTHYSEEISQTALALLALLAAGKSLDKATINSICSLFLHQNDNAENRVNLTIFSEHDDEGNAEPPVIIPFTSQQNNTNRFHNGYGTLSFKNRMSVHRHESCSRLRLFSPDAASYHDEDDLPGFAVTTPALRLYAE